MLQNDQKLQDYINSLLKPAGNMSIICEADIQQIEKKTEFDVLNYSHDGLWIEVMDRRLSDNIVHKIHTYGKSLQQIIEEVSKI